MSSRDAPDWWRPVGGANAQDSTLERRSLIWNDNGVLDGVDPPAFYTCETYKGKFFTRGCRGMIEEIRIYCKDAGADRIKLRYSPHPCLGPIGEVTITPLATWAWRGAAIEEMWNYDSLFIWVVECEAGTDWAYDVALPYDGHESADPGATWADMAVRPFIRVVYSGETPGDVPVSGIVNTIEIPSVATIAENVAAINVPHNAIVQIVEQEGAGTLIEAFLRFDTSVTPTAGPEAISVIYIMFIHIDGILAYGISNRALTQSDIATSGRSAVGEFWQESVADPAHDRTNMSLRQPLKFRRSIALYTFQRSGAAVDVSGGLSVNLIR